MSRATRVDVENLDWVEHVLTNARISPYLKAAAGDLDGALQFYALNLQVSSELQMWLAMLEISLRNTLIASIRGSSDEPAFDPLLAIWAELSPAERGSYKKASLLAGSKSKDSAFNALITQLPFGFWKHLLSSRHQTTLWASNFRHAFPELASKRRATVYQAVEAAVELRNRIAHHEPIFNRHLGRDLAQIQEIIGWISPDALAWARTHLQTRLIGVRISDP